VTQLIFIEADGSQHEVDTTDGVNIMQAAMNNGVDSILAECGGTLSCATCHVYVDDEWSSKLAPASVMELELLEGVLDPKPNSRLSCQIEVTSELDGMTLHLPDNQL
tara:strand:- start:31903 stop:32223 length:321 start_codon:yes stop_codon:yes gene_type:complete